MRSGASVRKFEVSPNIKLQRNQLLILKSFYLFSQFKTEYFSFGCLLFLFFSLLSYQRVGNGNPTVTTVDTSIKGAAWTLSYHQTIFSPRLLMPQLSIFTLCNEIQHCMLKVKRLSTFSTYFLNPKHLYYIYNNENVQDYKENGNTTNISIIFMCFGDQEKALFHSFPQMCGEDWMGARRDRTESKAANKMKKVLPFVALTFSETCYV